MVGAAHSVCGDMSPHMSTIITVVSKSYLCVHSTLPMCSLDLYDRHVEQHCCSAERAPRLLRTFPRFLAPHECTGSVCVFCAVNDSPLPFPLQFGVPLSGLVVAFFIVLCQLVAFAVVVVLWQLGSTRCTAVFVVPCNTTSALQQNKCRATQQVSKLMFCKGGFTTAATSTVWELAVSGLGPLLNKYCGSHLAGGTGAPQYTCVDWLSADCQYYYVPHV